MARLIRYLAVTFSAILLTEAMPWQVQSQETKLHQDSTQTTLSPSDAFSTTLSSPNFSLTTLS